MTKPSGLANICTYIQSLIASMEIIPTASKFVSFAELKSSPNRFYELFSDATYNYNIICDALQKLQHSNAMIVKVMNDLMSDSCREQYSVKTQYLKNFTALKTECSALISAYETAKSSSESVVKFYNSCQYIITSRNFSDTHANY